MLVTFTSYFIIGMSVAWPNTLFSHLTVNNTTLLGTQINFSNSQLDWMGSCSYGGMAVMMIPGGWIAGRLGRRRSIIIGAFIHALGWLIVALAVNFNMIITGSVMACRRSWDGAFFSHRKHTSLSKLDRLHFSGISTFLLEPADLLFALSSLLLLNKSLQL
ncbi:hypothetical protein Pmani_000849 [Petrolisthes manimaculis]|uniref:Major facilitator superfamily (MFS) profile domain-containing protein n=1 Tax=Petrolisthes manimaculis TaxID=1843537 RepID=A0AAE1UKW1_9EUCA|nr:hypothetical protein Pmani_000849 [Petrolisthes manimaculis]